MGVNAVDNTDDVSIRMMGLRLQRQYTFAVRSATKRGADTKRGVDGKRVDGEALLPWEWFNKGWRGDGDTPYPTLNKDGE